MISNEHLSARAKELFTLDSVEKKLDVFIYDNNEMSGFNCIKVWRESDIVSESLEHTIGITEENQFHYGKYSLSETSFSRILYNDFTTYLNKWAIAVISIFDYDGTCAGRLCLNAGRISKDEIQTDDITSNVTITTELYYRFQEDIFTATNARDGGYNGETFENLVGLFSQTGGIYIENINDWQFQLANIATGITSNFTNEKATQTSTYTLGEFFSNSAEIIYKFIREIPPYYTAFAETDDDDYIQGMQNVYITPTIEIIRADVTYDYLYPASDVYPASNTFPMFQFSFYNDVYTIPWVTEYVKNRDNIIQYTYCVFTTSIGSGTSNRKISNSTPYAYIVDNNLLLEFSNVAVSNSGTTKGLAELAQINALTVLSPIKIPATSISFRALPFLYPGDNVLFTDETTGLPILVPTVKATIKGINAMLETVDIEFEIN